MLQGKRIYIKPSRNADNRTADGKITKEVLYDNTMLHTRDVYEGCAWFASKLMDVAQAHDHTKLSHLDQFFHDFTSGAVGDEFKKMAWWQEHLKERHHLNDRVPDDVNLFDVIEMIIDCCMAGMARSGKVYSFDIPAHVLTAAVQNTVQMLINSIEVEKDD